MEGGSSLYRRLHLMRPLTGAVMPDTDARIRKQDHGSEEEWVDFVRQQAEPAKRARLERHLETGCSRCARTLRLWRAVLDVAEEEGAYRPPDEALRQIRAAFSFRRPPSLLAKMA